VKLAVQTEQGTVVAFIDLSRSDTDSAMGRMWLMDEIVKHVNAGRPHEAWETEQSERSNNANQIQGD